MVSSITFCYLETMLAWSSEDNGEVYTWNLRVRMPRRTHHVEKAKDVIGSPLHPLVIATQGAVGDAMICDTEHGGLIQLTGLEGAVAFMPDGRSFIASNGGLTTWDLRPLLEQRGREHGNTSLPVGSALPIVPAKALCTTIYQVCPFACLQDEETEASVR